MAYPQNEFSSLARILLYARKKNGNNLVGRGREQTETEITCARVYSGVALQGGKGLARISCCYYLRGFPLLADTAEHPSYQVGRTCSHYLAHRSVGDGRRHAKCKGAKDVCRAPLLKKQLSINERLFVPSLSVGALQLFRMGTLARRFHSIGWNSCAGEFGQYWKGRCDRACTRLEKNPVAFKRRPYERLLSNPAVWAATETENTWRHGGGNSLITRCSSRCSWPF